MGKGQCLLVKTVGPRLDSGRARVDLEKGADPGEDILESREGGRLGGPKNQREEPTRQDMFQGRSSCRQTVAVGPAPLVRPRADCLSQLPEVVQSSIQEGLAVPLRC